MISSILLSFVHCLAPSLHEEPRAAVAAPNVLFILCDDLGWGDLGVLHQNDVEGPKRLYTPHIDRLAAEGRPLLRHYCPAPVCAPSRASLLTGVHQGHATIRDNQFDKALEDTHTLPSILRAAGYRTALIGKYGLQGAGDGADTWPAYPTRRGFDSFYGYVRHRDGHSHYPAHKTAARGKMQVWDQDREVSGDLEGCYTTDLFTARAKHFLVSHSSEHEGRPFFLMLTYDTPHAALHVPTGPYPDDLGVEGGLQWVGRPGQMINSASSDIDGWLDPRVRDRDWSEGAKRFATMVHRIDQCIGDLMQTLEDLGLADTTFVVVTSDNGPHKEAYTRGRRYDASEFDSFGPYDGIKRDVLEGGIRVPTVVRWPGLAPGREVRETPSQFHDWMPTLCDLAGVPTPARSDGSSLLPWLQRGEERKPSTVYVEYSVGGKTPAYDEFDASHQGRKRGQQQAIFLDGYKGVRIQIQSPDDRFEIYDVEADPRETENLADTSRKFKALEQRMRARVLRIRRPDPTAKRPYDRALVPSVSPAKVATGFSYSTFEGEWRYLPEFTRIEPASSHVDGLGFLRALPFRPGVGILVTGYIDAPKSGEWTFDLAIDGAALLRIHESAVVEVARGRHELPGRASLHLEKGLHPFRLYLLPRTKQPSLMLRWGHGGDDPSEVAGLPFVRDAD